MFLEENGSPLYLALIDVFCRLYLEEMRVCGSIARVLNPLRISLLISVIILMQGNSGKAAPTVKQLQFFEARVRPLLAERCYRCHSVQAEKLKAGLLLDHGSTILKGGDSGAALKPGDPAQSLIIEAVGYGNPDLQMPPKKKLAETEIELLRKWVEMGAPWPNEAVPAAEKKLGPKNFDLAARRAEHWCWQPIQRLPPPEVKDKTWSSSPIDLHVLSLLESKGMKPSAPAGKGSLIRRVYFDLIGLPPTPGQVTAFVEDDSPEAFAGVIDELLGSPHFGERWGRHWMDLMRYAESCGHEFDYPIPHATEYRDYLIRAFNADVSYDQLVAEHIAGDLIGKPRLHPEENYNESLIGTGFWHLHEATHAPTDVRGNEAERVDNQIDVFSKTFLGLTVSCARCHDHMFDAISTKDYYALAGYLQSSRRQEALLDPGARIAAKVAELKGIKKDADDMLAKTFADGINPETMARYLMAAREAMRGGNGAELAKRHEIESSGLERWVTALRVPELKEPDHPLFVWSQFIEGDIDPSAAVFDRRYQDIRRRLADRHKQSSESVKGAVKFADFTEKSFGEAGWFATGDTFGSSPSGVGQWAHANAGIAVAGRAHGGRLAGQLHGVLRSPTFEITHNQIHHLVSARKGGLQIRLIIDSYVMEPYNGLLFGGTRINDPNTDGKAKWLSQGRDLKMYRGHKAHLEYIDHGNGHFEVDEIWFSDGRAPTIAPSATALKIAGNEKIHSVKGLAMAYGWLWKHASEAPEKLDEDGQRFFSWVMALGMGDQKRDGEIAQCQERMAQVSKTVPAPKRVQGLTDGTAENEFVFLRGNHKRLGDEVPRKFLTALGGERFPTARNGSGRLVLAGQVADPDNPLTSRVMVNRLWHHLFGRGIVATTDNFGALGQRPSNPGLLDHLAISFTDDGWSIKRALKRIMLSKTYQQASIAGGMAEESDPQNILLHRSNLRRLQGEVIRDSVLAISGRLDRKMFAGSVPVHLTDFMTGRGRPRGGPLDGQGRRSIYISVRRNFLSPMMLAFDTPIPFSSMGRRTVSNVPEQALIMMNDPFMHEQAGLWGKRMAALKLSREEVVSRMYLEAFARPPGAEELAAGVEFLGEGVSVEKLSDYAHVLFNTKEFIYLN